MERSNPNIVEQALSSITLESRKYSDTATYLRFLRDTYVNDEFIKTYILKIAKIIEMKDRETDDAQARHRRGMAYTLGAVLAMRMAELLGGKDLATHFSKVGIQKVRQSDHDQAPEVTAQSISQIGGDYIRGNEHVARFLSDFEDCYGFDHAEHFRSGFGLVYHFAMSAIPIQSEQEIKTLRAMYGENDPYEAIEDLGVDWDEAIKNLRD